MLALVTGASSGLGKALCQQLAKKGISLILVARDLEKLKQTAKELSVATQIFPADLTQAESRKKLIELIHAKKPDLIINNAGFGLYGPALTHPTAQFAEMVALNLQAVMEISLESARALTLAKKKGTILNISSAAAFFPYPTFCIYAATKSFVTSFSRGLDTELKSQGIRILTVCPGQIDTSFRTRASNHFPQKENLLTLSSEKAATLILKQIEKVKPFAIIDWRYRLLIFFAKLLPYSLLQNILLHSLEERYFKTDVSRGI